jgi:hypothetical protein
MESIPLVPLELPAEPFIAVFGTSHTSGSCRQGDKQALDKSQFWTDIISRNTGLCVVNFSIPGNTNATMLEQIISLLEQPGWKNCKMIIAEIRWMDSQMSICHSVFAPLDSNRKELMIPSLWGGHDHKQKWWNRVTHSNIAMSKMTHAYAERVVHAAMNLHCNESAPATAVDMLVEFSIAGGKITHTGHQQLIDDIRSIRAMAAIAAAHAVPFLWFNWNYMSLASHDNPDVVFLKEIFKKTTRVFDSMTESLYPSVEAAYVKEFGAPGWRDTFCECRHNNEVIHAFVAERISPEIQSRLRK